MLEGTDRHQLSGGISFQVIRWALFSGLPITPSYTVEPRVPHVLRSQLSQ